MRILLFGGLVLSLLFQPSSGAVGLAAEPVRLDLARHEAARGWRALHDLAPIEQTSEGLRLRSTGDDPYFESPVLTLPAGVPLILTIRARSKEGGPLQVFYYPDKEGATEANSVRMSLAGGDWREVTTVLPPLAEKARFRIDPPGGVSEIASLTLEPRLTIEPPRWPEVSVGDLPDRSPTIRSGTAELSQSLSRWNEFHLRSEGKLVAAGYPRPQIGYRHGAEVRWIEIPAAGTKVSQEGNRIQSITTVPDPDGGTWTLRQTFVVNSKPGTFFLQASAACDQDREIVFVPLLLLCPGLGLHGEEKGQGLFAGVEALDNEPSSSTADISGPLHERRAPIRTKITFPLMAIQHHGDWTGLIWKPSPEITPLFDSPDRTFQSKSHLMGLIAPGADPSFRSDGAAYPYRPSRLEANHPLVAESIILTGEGESVVPAIRAYFSILKLPELPGSSDVREYARLAARGWLETPIREGDRFRHALPGTQFAAGPASDAAWMMDQLAILADDAELSPRLLATAQSAWKAVEGKDLNAHRVGHIGLPVAPLVRRDVEPSLAFARQHAKELLGRFNQDGKILYHPGKVDYGRTHWSKEASGLEGQVVAQLLEEAAFCGDRELIAAAIGRLRGLDRFANTVPRGAQTWEVPLHTPDILGAAHLVRAYVLGYELTGDPSFLESANYWAWTGVPFVYLVNPTDHPIGPYATTPVLGATGWEAPLWIGLPVQWCGLVYADALLRLAPHDPHGPWLKLAHGIGRSGIQQVYPEGNPSQGLLPDSFTLEIQHRNIFDINPGTLHPVAVAALTGDRPYGFATAGDGKVLIHAAGPVTDVKLESGRLQFHVKPWMRGPTSVLIHGAGPVSEVLLAGKRGADEARRVVPGSDSLILTVEGETDVEIR